MTSFRIPLGLVSVGLLGICGSAAQAVPITFTINQNLSSITVAGSVTLSPFPALPLTPQGTGADVASYSGAIMTDVTNPAAPSSIQFLNGSAATAHNSGSWQPLSDGSLGSAPANYGLDYNQAIWLAIRNLSVGATSNPQAVTAGAFDASGLTLNVITGSADYNADAISQGDGSDDLSGNSGANTATAGQLVATGQTLTLTVPISISYDAQTGSATGTITLTGTIVATAAVPEPASLSVLALGGLAMLRRRRSHI